MKLYSWNVNGIRAAQRKGFLEWLNTTAPDILFLQETKAQPEQLDEALRQPDGYYTYWASAERKGYSGVALYSRKQPKQVTLGIGKPEFDCEGRTIVAEYDDFVAIGAYFPNGGNDLARVPYKMAYKAAFLEYCNALQAEGKPVIFCGDVNTSHNEIDIARPKQNEKNTGFLPIERAWMDDLVGQGYVDTFRYLYPETRDVYSWWSQRGDVRARNIGWRLDYFFISPDLLPRLEDAAIHTDTLGSDHCPVSLILKD